MKLLIRIFLWFSMIIHAGLVLGMLVLMWGPIYLAVTKGDNYNWFYLVGNICAGLSGFIVSLVIYKFINQDKKEMLPKNSIILWILLAIYLGLSTTFNIQIAWLGIIFALGLGALLFFHPKLVKKVS